MDEEINWLALEEKFDKQLTPGQRAEIRRVALPDDLAELPAYYHLLPAGVEPGKQWQRVIFILPWVKQKKGAPPIGEQFKRAGIDERRMFQMLRSNEPQDLLCLRRLFRQADDVSADWEYFGPSLYYWNKVNKRRFVEDYYSTSQVSK
ncbi:MAG: type I-E CRISPR-associated protein Cse2/CasB [Elusimicrobia bacterium]|nr:type I-E CRISPR-associated protein Cse2/CasB [Elusimicrobiota bacterium]